MLLMPIFCIWVCSSPPIDAAAAATCAVCTCRESHRKLLRQLFALVVRGSLAVQSLNAAMNQGPEGHAYYPAGAQPCCCVCALLAWLSLFSSNIAAGSVRTCKLRLHALLSRQWQGFVGTLLLSSVNKDLIAGRAYCLQAYSSAWRCWSP